MNVADYITSLTAAEARSGQGTKVKANKQTTGKSFIVASRTAPKTLTILAGTEIGVLNEVIAMTETNLSVNVIRRYAKILLDEPYYDDTQKLISYLWFRIEDLDFVKSATTTVKPVVNAKELSVIYANTVGGTRLRSTASTLNVSNIIRTVPLGDIVGYTDFTTKQYLTVTFYKVYSQTGKELGWVGKNNVSETKPQSKALPKDVAPGITDAEDPQANEGSSLSLSNILIYVVAIIIVIVLSILGYGKFFKGRKEKKNP